MRNKANRIHQVKPKNQYDRPTRLIARPITHAGDFVCVLCGDRFTESGAGVELVEVPGFQSDVAVLGPICGECRKDGKKGAILRMHKRANALRSAAKNIDDLAKQLFKTGEFPTPEDRLDG